MSNWQEEVRKALDSGDMVFRSLYDEHQRYDERLSELAGKPALTLDEEFEEKRLKKKKLSLKDQMAGRIRSSAIARSA